MSKHWLRCWVTRAEVVGLWVCRYGEPGGRATYCAEHQQEGMVDLKVGLHFETFMSRFAFRNR